MNKIASPAVLALLASGCASEPPPPPDAAPVETFAATADRFAEGDRAMTPFRGTWAVDPGETARANGHLDAEFVDRWRTGVAQNPFTLQIGRRTYVTTSARKTRRDRYEVVETFDGGGVEIRLTSPDDRPDAPPRIAGLELIDGRLLVRMGNFTAVFRRPPAAPDTLQTSAEPL